MTKCKVTQKQRKRKILSERSEEIRLVKTLENIAQVESAFLLPMIKTFSDTGSIMEHLREQVMINQFVQVHQHSIS